MKKKALITGVTGQDGSYLAEFLLEEKQYSHVIGLVRRRTMPSLTRRNRLPLQQCRSMPELPVITDGGGNIYQRPLTYQCPRTNRNRSDFEKSVFGTITGHVRRLAQH